MPRQELSIVPSEQERREKLESLTCDHCSAVTLLDFDFTFAFQPIVDLDKKEVHSYEALVRGLAGEGAGEILSRVTRDNRFRFDQLCRAKAISLAANLGMTTNININFLVNAVYDPDQCIRLTLECARLNKFPINRIILETTEEEKIEDPLFLKSVLEGYRRHGLLIAIDDFGEGYSSLNLMAQLTPEYLKLDRQLITAIDHDPVRHRIVSAMSTLCREMGIKLIAEGVETVEEARSLRKMGIALFQGYLFARPGFESLPPVSHMDL